MKYQPVLLTMTILMSVGLLLTGASRCVYAQEPAHLTVIGNVVKPNRPAYDQFQDAFFKFRDKEFKKAYEFSHDELASLPQTTITAHAKTWPAPIVVTGPTLQTVLRAAGAASNKKISFVALDGYTVDLDAASEQLETWIVGISVNSRPLGIGGRGPVWMLQETGSKTVGEDVEARWVWSTFLISID